MKSRQRGGMMVLMAGLILVLTSFAVLALDIGRIMITRNELQNAADAAALAGANCLTRQSDPGSATRCLATLSTTGLNWDRAGDRAEAFITSNSAAGANLLAADVQVGYWNLFTSSPSGGSFNTAFSPLTNNDRPAVRVAVTKNTGVNSGPLVLLTRLMFGSTQDPSLAAHAVAVISAPSTVPPGSLIPQAINGCMFDRFWDSSTNQPRIYTGSPVDPYGLSTVGQPWTVRIGSAYKYDDCNSGQWTSFDLNTNSNADIKNLIDNGNPTPMDIGDPTWIQPGTRTADYTALSNEYPNLPVDVAVAVTDGGTLVHTGTTPWTQNIIGFAGFRIESIKGGGPPGNSFYIQGRFLPGTVITGSGGTGPFLGAYTPPRLAQ